jgi:multidrug transporter EmrE-like cation transporter
MSFINVAGITASQIFGDFGFKEFVVGQSSIGMVRGVVGYLGVIFFLLKSLGTSNILWINGMWSGSTLIFESLAAFVLLGERFEHPWQYLALLMIIVGVIILKGHKTLW